MFKKNCNKGTINVLQGGGGGQRSMVKDHIFTFFFFWTLPLLSNFLARTFVKTIFKTISHDESVHTFGSCHIFLVVPQKKGINKYAYSAQDPRSTIQYHHPPLHPLLIINGMIFFSMNKKK